MSAAQQARDGLQQPSNNNDDDGTKHEIRSWTIMYENVGDQNDITQMVDTPPDCLAH
jgi:hypothetical protein